MYPTPRALDVYLIRFKPGWRVCDNWPTITSATNPMPSTGAMWVT